MPASLNRDQILRDVESLYKLALENDKWLIALRAKELQSKILGLFRSSPAPGTSQLSDMTEEELAEFLARLEISDPELKTL